MGKRPTPPDWRLFDSVKCCGRRPIRRAHWLGGHADVTTSLSDASCAGQAQTSSLRGFFVMATPNALILRAPGHQLRRRGRRPRSRWSAAAATRIHLNALRDNPRLLRDYQILVLPGGFCYGDDVAAGKILAIYMQHFLADALREFRDDEKLILGICNGFQAHAQGRAARAAGRGRPARHARRTTTRGTTRTAGFTCRRRRGSVRS